MKKLSKVNTVLGTIPAEELGIVAIHEHIGYGMPGSELDTQWWKTPEQRYEETVPKLRAFHEYGGGSFVDVTGICNGRDVDYYKSLSAKTGVNIIACTGFVGGDTALPHFARASVEYLAEVFIHEITVGLGDTGSKAGVIKVGVSRGGKMTDLDHFLRFLGEGHLDKALAGVDANCSPLGWPGVKGHTVNYLFEDLIPDLREAGVDQATIDTLFIHNPADFLSIQK